MAFVPSLNNFSEWAKVIFFMNNSNYKKIASYEVEPGEVDKIVLLYSGGLDTSMMLKWLQDNYQAEVIALTADIGQQHDDLEKVKQKALDLGASKAVVYDAKEKFAEVLKTGIKANATYQGGYHLSTPMGRLVLAQIAVETAEKFGAQAIAHGCTGKGNDQVRIEGYALSFKHDIKIIAPVREWKMSRDEQIDYAQKNGIPVPASHDFPYSVDDNIWGMTWEGGEIEFPDKINPKEKFLTTYTLPKNAPDQFEQVKIGFDKGVPVSLDGVKLGFIEIVGKLNQIGGKHGVGTVQVVEDRLVGVKNGGVYEQPGADILIKAHKALESYANTRELNELKDQLDIKWAYLCYGAKLLDPALKALNAFNDYVNQKVTGTVTMELFKGSTYMVAMESENGLANASFNNHEGYDFNVNASPGFTEIYTLQMKLAQ